MPYYVTMNRHWSLEGDTGFLLHQTGISSAQVQPFNIRLLDQRSPLPPLLIPVTPHSHSSVSYRLTATCPNLTPLAGSGSCTAA